MIPAQFIAQKRDGLAQSASDIQAFIKGLLAGTVTEYQMTAWLMAAYLQDLNEEETWALTSAMLNSGKILGLPSVKRPKIDKHSTGGVGDKISICLAPLVASQGVAVPMISGRGLGHTGGTLDKLEAIEGYQTRLDAKRFETIVRTVGTSMIGQTDELAPADRTIYGLRDVTATVESIPLITASILSKKLAEGIDGLVLDVKVGRGAFMHTLPRARRLAELLVDVGTRAGKRVVALVTDMNTPIGRTIGNALETREAIEILRNLGPADTRELTLVLGVEMLMLAGVTRSAKDARDRLVKALASGEAFECFARMVKAHGGNTSMVEDTDKLPTTKQRVAVLAKFSGWVSAIDPMQLAQVALELGAGRLRADQKIDPAVGITLSAKVAEHVEVGQPLGYIHVHSKKAGADMVDRVHAAFTIRKTRPKESPLVLVRVPKTGKR
jgi:pyrimidine-nucleoside phosphorylase